MIFLCFHRILPSKIQTVNTVVSADKQGLICFSNDEAEPGNKEHCYISIKHYTMLMHRLIDVFYEGAEVS